MIKVPKVELKNIFCDINSIKIVECKNSTMSVILAFKNLQKLTIDGQINSFENLSKLKDLKCLEIRNINICPTFFTLRKHSKIEVVRIMAKNGSWPSIKDLAELPNLKSLSVCSNNGPEIDYYLFEDICNLKNLKHLYLSCITEFDLDASPLAALSALEHIEIATYSNCLPSNVITLAEINCLKKITIRTDVTDEKVENFLYDVKMCLTGCEIQHISGWSINDW